jgi:hypothetical protein
MLPKGDFFKNKHTVDGLYYDCKACRKSYLLDYHGSKEAQLEFQRAAVAKSYQKHKAKRQAEGRAQYWKDPVKSARITRKRNLRKLYGLSQELYDSMLSAQGGCCALCGTQEPGGRSDKHFHIDHDHQTGRIRGLLCHACNIGLGWYEDFAQRIDQVSLSVYLGSPGSVQDRQTPLGADINSTSRGGLNEQPNTDHSYDFHERNSHDPSE